MSKFGCQCGHVISTTEYPNPNEGWIYGCEAREKFEGKIDDALSGYLSASTAEAKRKWLASFFREGYPTDLEDRSVIADIMLALRSPYLREVLECPLCGRLHIQEEPETNVWRSYMPEASAKPGILRTPKNA